MAGRHLTPQPENELAAMKTGGDRSSMAACDEPGLRCEVSCGRVGSSGNLEAVTMPLRLACFA